MSVLCFYTHTSIAGTVQTLQEDHNWCKSIRRVLYTSPRLRVCQSPEAAACAVSDPSLSVEWEVQVIKFATLPTFLYCDKSCALQTDTDDTEHNSHNQCDQSDIEKPLESNLNSARQLHAHCHSHNHKLGTRVIGHSHIQKNQTLVDELAYQQTLAELPPIPPTLQSSKHASICEDLNPCNSNIRGIQNDQHEHENENDEIDIEIEIENRQNSFQKFNQNQHGIAQNFIDFQSSNQSSASTNTDNDDHDDDRDDHDNHDDNHIDENQNLLNLNPLDLTFLTNL